MNNDTFTSIVSERITPLNNARYPVLEPDSVAAWEKVDNYPEDYS